MKVRYAIKNATFCATVALLFSIVLSGMEAEEIKNSVQVLSLILAERINFFNHPDICSIGSVDKRWNKIAMQTALSRRQILEERIAQESKGDRVAWHKYGSAYVDFFTDHKVAGSGMRFFHLNNNKKVSQYVFYGPYHDQTIVQRPIFDEKGNFNFYYLYDDTFQGGFFEGMNTSEHILGFSSYHHFHEICALQCIWKSREYNYPLSIFKTFPSLLNLLKVFLNSSFVCKQVVMGDQTINVQLFNLEDAIIPDNYRDEPSFYTLPAILQKALDGRYRVQGQKEEIITECFKTEELHENRSEQVMKKQRNGKVFGKKPCCVQ